MKTLIPFLALYIIEKCYHMFAFNKGFLISNFEVNSFEYPFKDFTFTYIYYMFTTIFS